MEVKIMENTGEKSLKPSWRISGQVTPGSLPDYVHVATIDKWSDPTGMYVVYALSDDMLANRGLDDETKRRAIDATVKWGRLGDDVKEQMRKGRFKGRIPKTTGDPIIDFALDQEKLANDFNKRKSEIESKR